MIRRFAELPLAGLDPLLARILEQDPGGEMTPLQQRAVAQTGLLRGADLLVQAPTASGKTLVAELAGLAQLGRGRAVLYLVPTRALAAEKAREFRARLAPHGLRVGWSAGDRRCDDEAILDGRAPVAVAVLEKGLALALRRPGWLRQLGLLAVDEVQLLGDPERGASVDLLLSLWRALPRGERPQLVALSAALARPHELAAWLGVELLEGRERRAPLREGVLDVATGVYRWRDAGREGPPDEEPLLPPDPDAEDPSPAPVAVRLAGRLGPVIVFCATRESAWRLAEEAALARPFPPASAQASAARAARAGLAGERLAALLEAGVAVHTADLTGPLRAAVEEAFAWGQAPVLFATATLDQGVNLRAAAVIHAPEVPDDGPGRGRMPLPRARFLNQGGRAGRVPGEVGRSILLGRGEINCLQLWRGIVEAPLGALRSPLGRQGSLVGVAAALLASGQARDAAGLAAFARGTLAAREDEGPVLDAINRAVAAGESLGFWRASAEGHLALTALGHVLATSGIQPATARSWAALLEKAAGAPPVAAAAFLVSLAPEWDGQPLAVAPWERRRNRWPAGMRARLEAADDLSRRLEEYVDEAGATPFGCHRASRRALLLDDWLGGEPLEAIEEVHGVAAGQLERLAATGAWLAAAASEVAGSVGAREAVVEALESLARELARRAALLAGEAPAEAAPSSPPQAPARAAAPVPPGDARPAPRLVFPADSVGEVVFDGTVVELPPLPHALLRLLAERAGRAVAYNEINERLWPDAQVQQQMISFHRNELVKRLGAGASGLVRTRPRWGLVLALEPGDVLIEEGAHGTAAA